MSAKYIRLADSIRQRIPQLKAEGTYKLPSEAALMQRHGVSRQTVRKALALLAAEGLVERRQGSGTYIRRLPEAAARRIAIMTVSREDYIYPALLQEISEALSPHGYDVSVYVTGNSVKQEREILRALLAEPVAGILAEGCRTALPNPNLDLYRQLSMQQTPVVFMHAAYAALPGAVCIGSDDHGGGYQLAKYLLDKGRDNIAGIFKSDDMQGVQRYGGCISALRDASLLPPDSRFLWFSTQECSSPAKPYPAALIQRFIQEHIADSNAVICYNDEIAYHLIKALTASGRRVPQDVAVAGFDNSYYCTLGAVGITSLGHAPREISRLAVQSLLEQLHGKPGASAALPWTLFERKSSR